MKNKVQVLFAALIIMGAVMPGKAEMFRYANGSKAYQKERVEVFSQERVFILDNWRRLEGFGAKGFKKMKGGMDKGQKDEFRMLNERLQNGGESLIPFESIVNTTKASFACIQSLKENRWIEVL